MKPSDLAHVLFHGIMLIALALAGLLAAHAPTPSQPQASLSLRQYFDRHPWNESTQGPMIIVDPVRTRSSNEAGGLASFDRKAVRVGSITAVVPTEMVIIDAELKDPPDLYDGLPREQKVLYLASLLNSDQWSVAATRGIGLDDLNKDQQAVFRSILPSTFAYYNGVMNNHGETANVRGEPAEVTLTAEEEAGVRLQFFKAISLGVRFAEDNGFSAIATQMGDEHKAGSRVLTRKDVAVEDETSLFGIKIRKTLSNAQKPTDLNFQSRVLEVPFKLPPKASINELCRAASQATGLHLMADIRIGASLVQSVGASARLGDVLQAICLGVTGTFRKVGDVYVLTSDREGAGAKRTKLAFWRWDLIQQTRFRSEGWKAAIRAKKGIQKVAYSRDTDLLPNDAMTKFMAMDGGQGDKTMPAGDLPPVWQSILNGGKHQFGDKTTVRMDVAEPWEEVFWNFVLPDGRPLTWEAELGDLNDFTRDSNGRPGHFSKSVVKPIPLDTASAPALVCKTENPADSPKLTGLAKSHGFKELWLHTWNPECASAAVHAANEQGMQVRLVIEPWQLPPGEPNQNADLNIFGFTFPEATALLAQAAWWVDAQPAWGFSPLIVNKTRSPEDPRRDAAWTRLLSLSKTPGLAGSVLMETEPPGYEPSSDNTSFGPVEMTSSLDLGYTQALRRQFLLENSVDPIDICDARFDFGKLNLNLPIFGDFNIYGMGALDSSLPDGAMRKWFKFLAEQNRQATSDFANQLSGQILFEPRQKNQGMPRVGWHQLTPWQPASELPMTTIGPFDNGPTPTGGYWLWQFGDPIDLTVGPRIYDNLTRHLKKSGALAVDVRAIPPEDLSKMLDLWFEPKVK